MYNLAVWTKRTFLTGRARADQKLRQRLIAGDVLISEPAGLEAAAPHVVKSQPADDRQPARIGLAGGHGAVDLDGGPWQTITLDDGSDFDRVDVPADAVDGMEKIGIAWWMRTDKTGESTVISGAASSGGNAANSFLLYFRRDNAFNPWLDQSTASVYSIDPISDNRWRHFVFNCDRAGGWHELYIDGELVERKTMTPKSGGVNVADGGLIVGEEQDSLGGGFLTAQTQVGEHDGERKNSRVQ